MLDIQDRHPSLLFVSGTQASVLETRRSTEMATLLVNRVPSVPPLTRSNQPSLLARTLLLAVLFSRLSSITASPFPSLPASVPGIDSREPLAPASDLESDTLPGLSIEYPDLEVTDPTTGLLTKDDGDWDFDYEDLIGDDERVDDDVMGNEVETDLRSSTESVLF